MNHNSINFEEDLRKALNRIAPKYYEISEQTAKGDLSSNRSLLRLKYYAKIANKILECGCGAGATLKLAWHPKADFIGIDISRYAIKKGKSDLKGRKNVQLVVADVSKLPFKSNSFDLVYSAYVIEHVLDAHKMVDEMIRVVKKGGNFLVIAPNYGSPIEFSPSFEMIGTKPLLHALKFLLLSHLWLIWPPKDLFWNKVEPVIIKTKKYFPDSDTVIEPYVQTLKTYISKKNIKIKEISSGLDWPDSNNSINSKDLPIKYKIFRLVKRVVMELGKKGISPYKYYGSTLFIVGEKL